MIDMIKLWFSRALPEVSDRKLDVQVGVHFEECSEMLESVEGRDATTDSQIGLAQDLLKTLANRLKSGDGSIAIADRKGFLDALCDQIVTATGCGYVAKLDIVEAVNRVNQSNFSKFDKDGFPVFDANGKIAKGPNYKKPDLEGLY